jgi:predicted phosphodiesterase
MLLGIVTDIHNETSTLRRALAEFEARGVDQVVSLGDACDCFSTEAGQAAEVASLLQGAGAIGVWGNHDIGLCYRVSDQIRQMTDAATLEYLAGMKPTLQLGDCHFSHVEPWLDACKVEDLWYYEGPPDTAEKASRSFAAVPQRYVFVGHLHRWLVMTPAGRVECDGEAAIVLNEAARYLVAVAPVVSGWCATFETGSSLLTPIRCGAG